MASGTRGSYHPDEQLLKVEPISKFMNTSDMYDAMRNRHQTLIHELQHGVQEAENWPRGGNPGQFRLQSTDRAAAAGEKAASELVEALQTKLNQHGLHAEHGFGVLQEAKQKHLAEYWGGAYKSKFSSPNFNKAVDLISQDPEMLYRFEQINSLGSRVAGRLGKEHATYKNLAGEAQARAAEQFWRHGAPMETPMTSLYDIPLNKLTYHK